MWYNTLVRCFFCCDDVYCCNGEQSIVDAYKQFAITTACRFRTDKKIFAEEVGVVLLNIFKEALLQRNMLVAEYFDPNESGKDSPRVTATEIAALCESYASLGYNFDADSVRLLAQFDQEDIAEFYRENYVLLARQKGADVDHKVFYPNFPNMENVTPAEYYLRAVLHYLTSDKDSYGFANQDIAPCEDVETVNNTVKTTLTIVSMEKAREFLVQTAVDAFSQKLPIPKSRQSLCQQIVVTFREYVKIDSIPFKENMVLYIKALAESSDKVKICYDDLRFARTVTDVLRLYAVMSGGDAELAEMTYFASLPRSSRRDVLRKLDELCGTSNACEDVQRNNFLWKRALEKLHPGEFANKFPSIYSVATRLRNKQLPKTFAAKLDSLLDNENAYLNLLTTRPTEFARRLDFMLRTFSNTQSVLSAFIRVSSEVSSNVLLSLWRFYLNRPTTDCTEYPIRAFVFYHDGVRSHMELDGRNALSKEVCAQVVDIIKFALSMKFGNYPQRGKLYIAPHVKNYMVPTSSRLASKQSHTLTFGTRIPLNAERGVDFVRLFTHWKNMENERVDVDLSVELVDEEISHVISLSWHDMAAGQPFDSYHSGDLTTAPEGASEFVDFDLVKARKYGRYAVVCNYCYTGQKFADIPECFSGIMLMPQRAKKGEVFNPQFVKLKFDLTQPTCKDIAFVLDLETKELIWADTTLLSLFSGQVASVDRGLEVALRNVLKKQVSMYDWMQLNGNRMQIVDRKEDADWVVDDTDEANVSVFDIEGFSANWM